MKMSILTIFVGMSELGEDLEETSFFNYFSISVCVVLLRQKVLLLLSFVLVCLVVFRFFRGS